MLDVRLPSAGAALFVEELMLLGALDGRAAAPINLFVGGPALPQHA
jgi:hypothetical protein